VDHVEDNFLVTFEFDVEGPYAPSFQQLETVFERMDQAALQAVMALEPAAAGWDIEPEDLPRLAREFLQEDEDAPRVLAISSGSITVKVFIKGAKQTAAIILAVGGIFGAADLAVSQADQLVHDTTGLITTINQVATNDPRAAQARDVLAGQGADPSIRLSRTTLGTV
jgi:hypothetical protein